MHAKCGYAQEGLCEINGIDYKYLRRIEGKKPPAIKIDTIERLAKALNAKHSDLLKF